MAAITFPIGSRIYLDANVFIYAAEAPKIFPQLIAILNRIDRKELAAFTSSLTLAEVLVGPLKLGNTALEAAYRRQVTTGPSLNVVDITRDILIRAANIRAMTPSVKLPDAIHAATSEAAGCIAFITNDDRIKSIPGLPAALLAGLAQ
jgi:predicted nucleic acid-binding protein